MMVGDNSEIELILRVLVTGAGGMLGRDVVLAATNAGHEVSALTRNDLESPTPTRSRRALTGTGPTR